MNPNSSKIVSFSNLYKSGEKKYSQTINLESTSEKNKTKLVSLADKSGLFFEVRSSGKNAYKVEIQYDRLEGLSDDQLKALGVNDREIAKQKGKVSLPVESINVIDSTQNGTDKGFQIVLKGGVEIRSNARGVEIKKAGQPTPILRTKPKLEDDTFSVSITKTCLHRALDNADTKVSFSSIRKDGHMVSLQEDITAFSPALISSLWKIYNTEKLTENTQSTINIGNISILRANVAGFGGDSSTPVKISNEITIVKQDDRAFIYHNGAFVEIDYVHAYNYQKKQGDPSLNAQIVVKPKSKSRESFRIPIAIEFGPKAPKTKSSSYILLNEIADFLGVGKVKEPSNRDNLISVGRLKSEPASVFANKVGIINTAMRNRSLNLDEFEPSESIDRITPSPDIDHPVETPETPKETPETVVSPETGTTRETAETAATPRETPETPKETPETVVSPETGTTRETAETPATSRETSETSEETPETVVSPETGTTRETAETPATSRETSETSKKTPETDTTSETAETAVKPKAGTAGEAPEEKKETKKAKRFWPKVLHSAGGMLILAGFVVAIAFGLTGFGLAIGGALIGVGALSNIIGKAVPTEYERKAQRVLKNAERFTKRELRKYKMINYYIDRSSKKFFKRDDKIKKIKKAQKELSEDVKKILGKNKSKRTRKEKRLLKKYERNQKKINRLKNKQREVIAYSNPKIIDTLKNQCVAREIDKYKRKNKTYPTRSFADEKAFEFVDEYKYDIVHCLSRNKGKRSAKKAIEKMSIAERCVIEEANYNFNEALKMANTKYNPATKSSPRLIPFGPQEQDILGESISKYFTSGKFKKRQEKLRAGKKAKVRKKYKKDVAIAEGRGKSSTWIANFCDNLTSLELQQNAIDGLLDDDKKLLEKADELLRNSGRDYLSKEKRAEVEEYLESISKLDKEDKKEALKELNEFEKKMSQASKDARKEKRNQLSSLNKKPAKLSRDISAER